MIIQLLAICSLSLILFLALPFVFYYAFKRPKSKSASFFANIVIGHRGAKSQDFDFEENTLESFRYAMEQKCHGIELDCSLTKDHKLVVFHDLQKLFRVFEESESVKDSPINDVLYDDLKKLKYKRTLTGEGIPKLVELLMDMNNKFGEDVRIMIEVKEYRLFESVLIAFKVTDLFQKYPYLHRSAIVASFNPFLLFVVRYIDPAIVTNFLYQENFFTQMILRTNDCINVQLAKDVRENGKNGLLWFLRTFAIPIGDVLYNISALTWLPSFIGCGIIGLSNLAIYSKMKDLTDRGYKLQCWGVNTMKDKKRLMKFGEVAITTDYVFE